MRWTIIMAASIAAAGCGAPLQSHIAGQLVEAGLPPAMAQCMAGIWAERLNVAQLRRIAQAAEEVAQVQDGQALGPLLERTRAMQDPEIIEVVTLSAARCAFNL